MKKKQLSDEEKRKSAKARGKRIADEIIKILDANKISLSIKLSGEERTALKKIRRELERGRTGRWRKPTTSWKRFGQFNQLIFQLPGNHGKWKFKYEEKIVIKFRDALWNILYETFGVPDNRLGLYMRPHPQCKDDREPEFHFHVVQAKHFFRWEDRDFMETFKNLPVDEQPFYALNLLHNIFAHEPEELKNILEALWRQAIFLITGRNVSPEHPPLVTVTSRAAQDDDDRERMASYSANPALHVFRDTFVKEDTRTGYVLLSYSKKTGGGKVSMPVVKFIKRYLLLPNKKLSIRWCPKGAFRSSTFQPILDAAARLLVKDGEEYIPFLNLPIGRIKTKAEIFRERYESEGAAGVESLKRKYKVVPRSGRR